MFIRRIKLKMQSEAQKLSPSLSSSFSILVSCFCLLFSLPAAADSFQLLETYTKVPEAPPAKSFTLLTDDHQITFIPPDAAFVELHWESREVAIRYQDERCLIKLRLSTNNPTLLSPDFSDHLRQLVQERYPGAAVGPAEVCHNSCSPGRYFDIQRPTALKTKLMTRLAFVPIKGGMLEVSLSASDAKFHVQQFAMSRLLNSFLVEKPDPNTLILRKDK